MSRFLFFSAYGNGLPLALRLQEEGHDVLVYLEDHGYAKRYDGMLPKASQTTEIDRERICLFDMTGIGNLKQKKPETDEAWQQYTNLAGTLRRQGHRVIGGGEINDRMEWDRTWGAKLARQAGLLVPETHQFDDLTKAIDFVRSERRKFIVKPHGNLGTMKNYPCREWTDLVRYLEWARESGKLEDAPIEVQEWIDGQQIAIEGWVCRHQFYSLNSTFEFKPLLPENHGPYTGETGSVIFYYPPGRSTKLEQEVMAKFEPMLKELDYPDGPLDLNGIVNEDGWHFLEFSPRMGYPAEIIQINAVKDNWGEAFERIAEGTFEGFTPTQDKWHSGVLITVPRWPYDPLKGEQAPAEDFTDFPMLFRVKDEHQRNLHLTDVHLVNNEVVLVGTDGEVGLVRASGESIDEVEAEIKRVILDIELYPLMWRGDVGKLIRLADLKHWGFYVPDVK